MMKNGLKVLAVMLLAAACSQVAAAGFVIPTISLDGKQTLADSELLYLRDALESSGLIAFANVPGFKEARRECFRALRECYATGEIHQDESLSLVLPDGTKRVTLAMRSLLSTGAVTPFKCIGLGEKVNKLQSIVDTTSRIFARALDLSVTIESQKPLLMASNNAEIFSYPSFSEIISHGDHLDHFHIYDKQSSSPTADEEALKLHTDQGLFIALVPSLSLREGQEVEDGFEIQLKSSGAPTRVTVPNNGDALVFMIGDGMRNFINKKAIHPVRPVPHRLVMGESQVIRTWFGRMFFPPKDAYITSRKTTFDKLHIGGCSNAKHVLRDLTEVACGANEIYCWMACRPIDQLSCSGNQTIQCVNQDDGKVWTKETEHCFSCSASCFGQAAAQDSNNTADNGGFCNTKAYPTNMYMDGFNGLGPNIPCLVFLFQSWVMDTQVKYAFGSIGAFLIGVTIEFLILLRRETRLGSLRFFPDASKPRLQSFVLVTLYATQLVLAYFAMLLAMSFAAVIFAMVMLGFVVGHCAFNFQTQAAGNEACCSTSSDQAAAPKVVSVDGLTTTCCGENEDRTTTNVVQGGDRAPTIV